MKSKPTTTLFGYRLRQARQLANIPQDRLGVAIGLDEHTASARISRYETGVHEPSFETLQDIAQALGLPPAFFYCDDNELAELIMMWGHLKSTDQRRIMTIVAKELAKVEAKK